MNSRAVTWNGTYNHDKQTNQNTRAHIHWVKSKYNWILNVSLLSYICWHLQIKRHIKLLYIYIYTNTYTYIYIYAYIYIYIYIYIYSYTHTYIHIYTHMHTYIHTHSYTHTNIHILIYTKLQKVQNMKPKDMNNKYC